MRNEAYARQGRIVEATAKCERLIDLYAKGHQPGETAVAFFGRVDMDVVKASLADLERLRPGDAVPADFIDLGEANEFAPEVMDGECSA